MTRITLLSIALVLTLCIYECNGRKQKTAMADSLVSEDTSIIQPHDSAPDETSGVAPGEKKQAISAVTMSPVVESSPSTKVPKGKNGKRGKNGNGLGKKVKKNRNNQQSSSGSSDTNNKRKNKNKNQSGSDVPSSTSRGKKNKNQARATSTAASVDSTVE